MYIPITDDRYFTAGTDHEVLFDTPFYTSEEYDEVYPTLVETMPGIFSVNLKEAMTKFATSSPPAFGVSLEEVIELACYYYADWDSVVAVTDELVRTETTHELRKSLTAVFLDVQAAEHELQNQLAMLTESLRDFINIVVGVLSRSNIPSIMDFGCCYRFYQIDNAGNVYFKIAVPEVVYKTVEQATDCCALQRPR